MTMTPPISDHQLPAFALGTGSFRGLYREVSDAEAISTIHYALDQQVTLLDTAPWYGAFQAEALVGQALATRRREQVILSTKACLWSVDGAAQRGYRRDEVLWSVAGSLQRLGVSRLDWLHIHDPLVTEAPLILDETYPTLAELKAQGVIGAIGMGTGTLAAAEFFADRLPLDAVMLAGRYTLLDQSALPLLNRLHRRGVPVLSAGMYATGILATGAVDGAKYHYAPAPAGVLARTRRLEALCQAYHIPLRAAAAQFVRAHPAIQTIIFGAESVAQVAENLAVFSVAIPPGFWHDLHTTGLIDPSAPVPGA
ncbi:MAG: aldo/keto reductase [Anaerolineae bacterium]|jgi:D-threo-aldose 1-dehydrogenase|nr:aldo/keto reductase [Anaerolineae bacterium]